MLTSVHCVLSIQVLSQDASDMMAYRLRDLFGAQRLTANEAGDQEHYDASSVDDSLMSHTPGARRVEHLSTFTSHYSYFLVVLTLRLLNLPMHTT